MRPSEGFIFRALLDERLCGVRFSFLNQRSRDIQPCVRVAGLGHSGFSKREFGAFQIALQKQSDAPVVPALSSAGLRDRVPLGRLAATREWRSAPARA